MPLGDTVYNTPCEVERNAGGDEMLHYLQKNNYVTIKQDGIFKVLMGHLDIKELLTMVET